jgi:signal peptidase II
MNRKRLLIACLSVGLIASFDHWTKTLILANRAHLPLHLSSFFSLVFAQNRGVSFGFLKAGSPTQVFLLGILASTISLFVLKWYLEARGPWLSLGLLLILGGAVGNLMDRFLWGAVIDFLDFHLYSYSFPTFNVADVCISCGVGVVFLTQLMEKSSK